MRVFGIDPGSQCTGYGCVDSDGRRHQLVLCGAVRAGFAASFPEQLSIIYRELSALIAAEWLPSPNRIRCHRSLVWYYHQIFREPF
jgi:Holliday junction resolvasome RuvABC endonuclease subunit